MKKILTILTIIMLIVSFNASYIYARAGGGGSSSGSSGGSSSGSPTHSGTNSNSTSSNPIARILNYIIFGFITFFSAILFRIKLMKAKRNSKKLMNLLDNKDDAWKYKNIQKQVEESYFVIQNAWTNQDMASAKDYMEKGLYENFNSKIEWMQLRNEKNVLKKISLKEAMPVSIYDDENDQKDFVWYYINGNMIDYTININTNELMKGNEFKKSFVEYWKYVRKEDTKWVLAEILQEDEKDRIPFQS